MHVHGTEKHGAAQGETNMASMELIAAKAGVSRGTVDRVLHNRGQVKPETAEKVRTVMAELGLSAQYIGPSALSFP